MAQYNSNYTGSQIDTAVLKITNASSNLAHLGSGIGTCATSSGKALAVTLSGYNLVQNGIVAVTFQYDVPAGATLNINSKGAKPIYYKGAAILANTIKANDTVMFCYNGSQYVVTSPGSGRGSTVYPEFVNIQLTQSGSSDSDLIGATVVVTNNNTSDVILSTTWNGSVIVVLIDAGVYYTVTVGDRFGLTIRQHSQSYTAVSGLARIIEFSYIGGFVNMGLSSRVLWASGNIVSNGNGGYRIGNETDYGAYVSWGNVTPHFSTNGSTFDDGYNWGSDNTGPYRFTPGSTISGGPTINATYAPNSGYDVARELLGGKWRMPTCAEFIELHNNCTSVWTTKNGITGREFTSKINGAKIFFPAAGFGRNTSVMNKVSHGFYWSSSLNKEDTGHDMMFSETFVLPDDGYSRYQGFSVRAVQ